MTFDEAVKRATEHNPTVGRGDAGHPAGPGAPRSVEVRVSPLLYGDAGTVILDAARGFDGNVTQPRTQSAFNATVSYPVLAAARWAAKNQAADQVGIARISAQETRRQVALTAAQSYLAVVAAQRQREIAHPQPGHGEGPRRVRQGPPRGRQGEPPQPRALDAGAGRRRGAAPARGAARAPRPGGPGRLDLRRRSRRCGGRPRAAAALLPSNDGWLDAATRRAPLHGPDAGRRPGGARLLEVLAATGTASFTPQYVTPAGFFEPARTWRAVFQLHIPIYDATLGRRSGSTSPTWSLPASASTRSRCRRAPSCGSPRNP